MPGFDIKIENIVASATLNSRVDLDKVVEHLEGTEYEPEQFPGIVYRFKDPKAATLIFSSGKIVCTGTRNIEDVNKVIKKLIRLLRETETANPKNPKIQIENIVASAQLKMDLNLDKIAFELENSEYEPEQFPGLVYRISEPKVAFLLFSSGKIVCTGARSIKEIESAIKLVSKRLKKL
ncbi:MAG: TATA-box-binding protein [Candidatus Aenigmarchaeota archaeon]|nr:TATA-box-binding protein [Candidatus Aenigmarchaeota archaeon]